MVLYDCLKTKVYTHDKRAKESNIPISIILIDFGNFTDNNTEADPIQINHMPQQMSLYLPKTASTSWMLSLCILTITHTHSHAYSLYMHRHIIILTNTRCLATLSYVNCRTLVGKITRLSSHLEENNQRHTILVL